MLNFMSIFAILMSFLRDMLQRVSYLARGRRGRKKSDFTLYVTLNSVFSNVIVHLKGGAKG